MDQQARFNFYKDLYFFELQRRDAINASVSLLVGVVALLGGGIFYYLNNLPSFSWAIWSVGFYACLLLGATAVAVTIYQLMRAIWSLEYYFLPTVATLEGDRMALESYLARYGDELRGYRETYPDVEIDYNTEFEGTIIRHFARASKLNSRQNHRKSAHIHQARVALVGAIVFLALSLIPFHLGA